MGCAPAHTRPSAHRPHLQLFLQLCGLAFQGPALLERTGKVQKPSEAEDRGRPGASWEGQCGSLGTNLSDVRLGTPLAPVPTVPTHESLQLQKGWPLSEALLPLVRTQKAQGSAGEASTALRRGPTFLLGTCPPTRQPTSPAPSRPTAPPPFAQTPPPRSRPGPQVERSPSGPSRPGSASQQSEPHPDGPASSGDPGLGAFTCVARSSSTLSCASRSVVSVRASRSRSFSLRSSAYSWGSGGGRSGGGGSGGGQGRRWGRGSQEVGT